MVRGSPEPICQTFEHSPRRQSVPVTDAVERRGDSCFNRATTALIGARTTRRQVQHGTAPIVRIVAANDQALCG